MNELTPYAHIEPAHLHGYSNRIRANSCSRLCQRPHTPRRHNLYSHTCAGTVLAPWSDYIIHNIHLRVLRHNQSGYRSELILVSDCQLLIRVSTIGEGGAISFSASFSIADEEQMATNKRGSAVPGRFGQLSQRCDSSRGADLFGLQTISYFQFHRQAKRSPIINFTPENPRQRRLMTPTV